MRLPVCNPSLDLHVPQSSVLTTGADLGATVLTGSQCRIVALNTTRQSVDGLGLEQLQIVPSPVVLTGSPLFCLDFLHHLDFQVPLSQ